MDPAYLKQMMQQMGIDITEINADSVTITTKDGNQFIFEAPNVTRMAAQGNDTYQVVGNPEIAQVSEDEIERKIKDMLEEMINTTDPSDATQPDGTDSDISNISNGGNSAVQISDCPNCYTQIENVGDIQYCPFCGANIQS